MKLERLTNAKESLFWPTAAARDWKDSGQLKAVIRKDGKSRLDTLGRVVCKIENGPPDQANPSTNGKNQECGKLNPNWVEQLMGLPVGWTQLPTAWIG